MDAQADLNKLLDKAREISGSDYKTAKLLGTTSQTISNWRHGQKTCAPADVALIAEIAGLDASAWALRAMVAKYEGTPKGDRLMKAVGKALLVTGVAIASAGANAQAIYGWTRGNQVVLDTMYILSRLRIRRRLATYDLAYVNGC